MVTPTFKHHYFCVLIQKTLVMTLFLSEYFQNTFSCFFPWSLSSSSSTCYLLWWPHLHALPWSMMDTEVIKNHIALQGAFDSLWKVLIQRQFKALKQACVSVQNLKSRKLNTVEVSLVKVKNILANYSIKQIQQKCSNEFI